ncbi:Lrp/AsnC family transcriptional regulator [Candidatus Woesearchaeota archaeon]|nr:MAG: AsnC family transcriptional regulator [Candidatus Woesearchaeota archaeon ex4484_78]RLE46885.1 MAG: Lrp/AsnC family transcriptional regulator [Candidatus Woesearchaeota archaeon]
MQAFVQIATDTIHTQKILEELNKLPEIKEVYMLFGEWDILARVEVKDSEQLGNFVVNKIRSIEGVRTTSTQIVAKTAKKE